MKAKFCFPALLMAILFGNYFTGYSQQETANPHKFDHDNWRFSERCNPCHVYSAEEEPNQANGFLIAFEKGSRSNADTTYLSGISKLCFTCHDGTVAGFTHSGQYEAVTTSPDGINHPVSVLYRADSLGNNRLYNPNTTQSGLGGTIMEDMLVNGRVECTSCHDAHFSAYKTSCRSCPPVKNGAANSGSLWISNDKSALCLTCHNL